jgi:hypothetical protein
MKKFLAATLLILSCCPLLAQRKSVYVHGYTRRDGTYVSPHYRAAPGTARSYAPPPSGRSSYVAPLPSPSHHVVPSSPPPSVGRGKVYVPGYTRKDGTYVAPHYRSAPGEGVPRRTFGALHLDAGGSDLSRWAASRPLRPPAVRIPTFRYDPSTSNQKARDYLKRSAAAKRRFMRQTGYPHGRPGYIIDHVIPLACGGPDEPSNMQWQTIEEAKRKDAIERKTCG